MHHWRLQQRGLLRGFQGAQGKGFLGSTPPLELNLGSWRCFHAGGDGAVQRWR